MRDGEGASRPRIVSLFSFVWIERSALVKPACCFPGVVENRAANLLL
jgi:hypothetical protein